ncbi:MAG TPA: PQQ-binding-like beta-propeller repeat protein [Gemmataceae bacterium]|nr:PQQ-binding-like beta-propeller repeat protein [Gemmataceae bacterium]
MRRGSWVVGLVVGLALLAASPARALITALTPLQDVLKQSTFIVSARIESVDAEKPAIVLVVEEDLKGKAPVRKLPILLMGDAEAKKKNHVPIILKRVAPKLPILLFILQQGKKYTAFAYTNGTWFQIVGVTADGAVRWRFTHGEPYLRKTFKGGTAELKQTVVDGLSGKKAPPKPDTKEKPGFGPEVETEKKTSYRCPSATGPVFAVIPTVLVGGPLAILAMLFPAVFGGLILVMRRWMVALSVLSLNSTLYALQTWYGPRLAGSWWGTPLALWITMMIVTVLAILWAWRRHVAILAAESVKKKLPSLAPFVPPSPESSMAIQKGPPPQASAAAPANNPAHSTGPGRGELITLGLLSVLCLALAVFSLRWSLTHLDLWDKMLLMFSAGLWMATLHALSRRLAAGRRGGLQPGLPGEGVLLGTMLLVGVAFSSTFLSESSGAGVSEEEGAIAVGERQHRVAWRFQPKVERCWIACSPIVDGERVYVGVVLPSAFKGSGAVYCVDRKTGKEIWMFNEDGDMKDVFSSPCVADGRLYIGEGFHQHSDCKLYCLDAATGKKLWDFTTTSHTESSPCVVRGKVYFGAGDDGLYCLDAATGKQIWHLTGLHVDANPLVIDNRLYGGSGVGDYHKATVLFCLNADTGEESWRMAVDLPVWGMPAVQGEYVFAGIGNGNFLVSADQLDNPEKPAGAVLCLERATGKRVWRYDVRDGVHVRVCVDDKHVWFASRDRHCYCLDRREGKRLWKTDIGSSVLASPALVGRGDGKSLYVAGSDGLLRKLDAETGNIDWTFDAGKDAGQSATVFSSPLVKVREGQKGESRLIWFGCGLNGFTRGILYCLEERAIEPASN